MGMGHVNNRVGALNNSVIVFMNQTNALEIVYGNIRELAELVSVMKAFLTMSFLNATNGHIAIL
jgi:hypothetical protein